MIRTVVVAGVLLLGAGAVMAQQDVAVKQDNLMRGQAKALYGVIQKTVKGEDVTEEFIDIEARLKAKRALEQQFVEIMKRANSVNDALNVERQLSDVRGEIEKIEGRKRFLENRARLDRAGRCPIDRAAWSLRAVRASS